MSLPDSILELSSPASGAAKLTAQDIDLALRVVPQQSSQEGDIYSRFWARQRVIRKLREQLRDLHITDIAKLCSAIEAHNWYSVSV